MASSVKSLNNLKIPAYFKELEVADKLIFIKRYEKARLVLENLLQSHASNLLIHLRYIELAVRLGDTAQVEREYQQHHDEMVSETGCVLLRQYNCQYTPAVAIEHYKRLLARFGDFDCAYFGLGFGYEHLGDYDAAIDSYTRCLELNASWYPSYFGLSQCFYQKDANHEGDLHFQAFEDTAPYSIYGNFETHRKLSIELFEQEHYDDALRAMDCLLQWLKESGQSCPLEVSFYRSLLLIKISRARDSQQAIADQQEHTRKHLEGVLERTKVSDQVLAFMVASCQELGCDEFVLAIYQALLRKCDTPQLVQMICETFYVSGNYQSLIQLLEGACAESYDNHGLRFWLLVSKLKHRNLNAELYLADKERVEQLRNIASEKIEMLHLLNAMQARFADDPDVYRQLAAIYEHDAKTKDKANFYLQKMQRLDPKLLLNAITYARFLLKEGDGKKAVAVLAEIEHPTRLKPSQRSEFYYLQARACLLSDELTAASESIKAAVKISPWSFSYLACEIFCLTSLYCSQKKIDTVSESVINLYEKFDVNAAEFKQETLQLLKNKMYYLAYSRAKLLLLYSKVDHQQKEAISFDLLTTAVAYDPDSSARDFIKLLNTNYESPYVYFVLAILNKECWRHESSCLWLEMLLQKESLPQDKATEVYLELADSYVWRGHDLPTAIEYAQNIIRMSSKYHEKALTILTHAYLKNGDLKLAQKCMNKLQEVSQAYETTYLQGLLAYRQGNVEDACTIWQPILQCESSNLRLHNVKQEVLKLYTNGRGYREIS
ncbi:MAG: tetratricopeptide repeat protein [Pseudomonadota bacterium]|nr:tetratricopeptide repeat protein [Pseudomonadota bacterium]